MTAGEPLADQVAAALRAHGLLMTVCQALSELSGAHIRWGA